MTASKIPQLAIFDLGNVIFPIDWEPMYDCWSRASGIPAVNLKHLGSCVRAVNLFEINAIDANSFRLAVNNHLGITLSEAQFIEGWCSIFLEPNLDVCGLLPLLRERMKLVAFSNTNELHAQVWSQLYRAELAPFHTIYRSSQIGMRKPDAAGFLHLLNLENVAPQDAVFFDDTPENVEAARRLGITSVLVDQSGRVGEFFQQFPIFAHSLNHF